MVEAEEKQTMKKAANKMADAIEAGGIIHVFGCGHSNLLAEELYYRAGGLVVIRPIFDENLMLYKDAVRASKLERDADYANQVLKHHDIRKDDILIVISTSGRNPVPIDVARFAKKQGAYVIGMSSARYANYHTSRHESGKFLKDVVDLFIDNHVPLGDAILQHEQVAVSFAPSSTVIGAAILNSVIGEAIVTLADKGVEPPILRSGNIDGADEHNKIQLERYRDRIPLWRENYV